MQRLEQAATSAGSDRGRLGPPSTLKERRCLHMTFTITCNECGSIDCTIETEDTSAGYTNVTIQCNACGNEE